MIVASHKLAAAAEALVDAPFRLHGRDPATGLDCIGVILAAFAGCGRSVGPPPSYALRNTGIAHILPLADRAGLVETTAEPAAGDVILVRPGPAQYHLLIQATDRHFIHAHAGLRRVVRHPAPLPWPVAMRWHLPNSIEG